MTSLRSLSPEARTLVGVTLALALAAVVGLAGGLAYWPTFASGFAASPRAADLAPAASPDAAAQATAVTPARAAPPLVLTAQDGTPFDLASLRGAPVLVFFGYTHCPDVCPTTLADARDAMKRSPTPFKVVFVTVDPERDTPAALSTYLSYYKAPIIGLSGTAGQIRATADAWGVRYARVEEGAATGYAMAHTADAFLVDAAGMLREVIPFGSGPQVMADRVADVVAHPAQTPDVAVANASPTPSTGPAGGDGMSAGAAGGAPVPAGISATLMSTVVRAGQNRLVIDVMADMAQRRYVNGQWITLKTTTATRPQPDVVVSLGVQPVDRPAELQIVATRFVWVKGSTTAAYVADVTFPSAGSYLATVVADGSMGRLGRVEVPITVQGSSPVVAAGDPAPSVDTPTASDVGGDLRRISTDTSPDARFYASSVADLLAARRPFVLTFYSPAFCPTKACGPLLDTVKVVADEFPDVAFVHVEPYVMVPVDGRLQPTLKNRWFEWAPWSVAYGIPTEPWVFVVGADGRVATNFELIVGTDELRAAIRSVAGGP